MSKRIIKIAVTVAATAITASVTGLALAQDSQPSVQVEFCKDGNWSLVATGVNQNGATVSGNFTGRGCTLLGGYWWAIGRDVSLRLDTGQFVNVDLSGGLERDGQTVRISV